MPLVNLKTIAETRDTVFRFVEAYIRERGESPRYEEIAEGCGLCNKSVAFRHVEALIDQGRLIKVTNYQARSLRLAGLDPAYTVAQLSKLSPGQIAQLRANLEKVP
jgi:SOS-response transcriptional repressor LexA